MENTVPQMPMMMPPVAQPVAQEAPSESKWWVWVIVMLVLIAAGVAGYFILYGADSVISSKGDSIPVPPALPIVSSTDDTEGGKIIPAPPSLPTGSSGESLTPESPL